MTFEDFISANSTANTPQGWNGLLYFNGSVATSDSFYSSNLFFPDYGLDDTGQTNRAFYYNYWDSNSPTYHQYIWFTGGYATQFYTDGVLDTSYTGVAYDEAYGSPKFYRNGIASSGGYSGNHFTNGFSDSLNGYVFRTPGGGTSYWNGYSYSTPFTGFDYDYSYDPTGQTQYFFFRGISGDSGGFNGYYYNGDGTINYSYSGFAPDYGYDSSGNTQYLFNNGQIYSGGWYDRHYTNGLTDSYTGIDYDSPDGENVCYVNGYGFTGAYSGYYFQNGYPNQNFTGGTQDYQTGNYIYLTNGVQDNTFNGVAMDYSLNTYLLYLNGVPSNGGWVGSHYSASYQYGFGYDNFTGIDVDYGWDISGQSLYYFSNGYGPQNLLNLNYPDPSDVRSGVSYGLTVPQKVGTLSISNGGGGSSSGINIGQLIGLPPFIKL